MPDHWLADQITQLRNEIRESRQEVKALGSDLLAKLEAHKEEDDDVEKRVTIIETERKTEKTQALGRQTWIVLAASGFFTFLWNLLRDKVLKP